MGVFKKKKAGEQDGKLELPENYEELNEEEMENVRGGVPYIPQDTEE